MKNDYGYFGKGITGYMHYKQAFDRNNGGGKGPSGNGGGGGCSPLLIVFIILLVLTIFSHCGD